MGDIIEKSVMYYDPVEYYKPCGKSMWFDIKTHHRALVGLTKSSKGKCKNWIEFHNPGVIRLEFSGGSTVRSGLPFTLTHENFTRFWVAWDSKFVWVGIGESLDIVVSKALTTEGINYITVSTRDRVHPCEFKFEVPPLCLKMPHANTPSITAGKLEWKTCDNQLPDDAVIGGHIDGEAVYIIRSYHRGSLTPGVFVPSQGQAFIAWGGSDNPTGNFEALCGFNFEWKPASGNKIPAAAFVAGHSEENHELLYIGRAKYKGHVIPGKVQLSHKVCYIPFNRMEKALEEFEVLTVPGASYSENEFVTQSPRDFPFVIHGDDHDSDNMEMEEDESDHEAYAF